MDRKNRFLLVLCLALLTLGSFAQTQTVLDGAYVREHNPTRKVISYPYLREADVMWARRIWQVIDLRQKINHPLYFPTEELDLSSEGSGCSRVKVDRDPSPPPLIGHH